MQNLLKLHTNTYIHKQPCDATKSLKSLNLYSTGGLEDNQELQRQKLWSRGLCQDVTCPILRLWRQRRRVFAMRCGSFSRVSLDRRSATKTQGAHTAAQHQIAFPSKG